MHSNKFPKYISSYNTIQSFKHPNSFSVFPCRKKYSKNSCSLCVVNDWNKLSPKIHNFSSYLRFRNTLINFISSLENKIFNIHDQFAIKLLKRLQLVFSHLREHKPWHNFLIHFKCSCSTELETTNRFFLHCQFYNVILANLMSDFIKTGSSLPPVSDGELLGILLYSNKRFDTKANQNIFMRTLKFIKYLQRFDSSLFCITCFIYDDALICFNS